MHKLDNILKILTFNTSDKKEIIKLWDIQGGLIKLIEDNNKTNNISFSPDGQQFIADGLLIKIRNKDGKVINSFPENISTSSSVTFSPNGKLIAVGYNDGSVKLLNTKGEEILNFKHHKHQNGLKIVDLVFTPDSKQLITNNGDTVAVWDLTVDSLLQKSYTWLQGKNISIRLGLLQERIRQDPDFSQRKRKKGSKTEKMYM